jgi:hypothetical protein
MLRNTAAELSLAFAFSPFSIAQCATGAQVSGVDQAPGLRSGNIVDPQIQAFSIVFSHL